jgi:hypothetical protein
LSNQLPVTRTELAAYLAKQPREKLEELYNRHVKPKLIAQQQAAYQAELDKRLGVETEDPTRSWALSFGGKPIEFLREVAPDWGGGDEWARWRIFVKTFFGCPLDNTELDIYQTCTGLSAPDDKPQREAWLPVGRRGGKSVTLAMIAVYVACCFDWTPYLRPGQFGYVDVLSDSRAHAGEIMNYVKGVLGHPRLRSLVQRPLTDTVELAGRVRIQVVTASIKAVRSYTAIAALLDEIAHWEPDEESANPDVEILRALRPSMATIPGSFLLGASSRYARKGVLWEAYRDHYGKPGGPLVWSADTITMHPRIDRDFLATEEERDPVAFASEYGLEWRSGLSEFIDRDRVEALIIEGRYELPYVPGLRYYAFVDAAGGSGEDSMTIAIAYRDPKTGKGVLAALRERRPPFSPHEVVERDHAPLLKAYKVSAVTGDRYAANWCSDQYRMRGIAYHDSEMTASDYYRESLPLLNGGKVELLDDKKFIGQVCNLERTVSKLGKDTITHPPRQHDDLANVGLGALVMAAGGRGGTIFSAEAVAKLAVAGSA